jgi:hypothetical protein
VAVPEGVRLDGVEAAFLGLLDQIGPHLHPWRGRCRRQGKKKVSAQPPAASNLPGNDRSHRTSGVLLG